MRQRPKIALRFFLACLLTAQAMLVAAQTGQPPYPTKPIKILVGVPPGGSTDGIARLFAAWLQESLGQATIVDNRPGANTAVAADALVRSPADGYTLLVATDALVTVPLMAKVTFDPLKDLVPVGTLAMNRFVLAVHPSVPVNNLQEFIAYAKARPGKLSYGSSGNGGTSHLGIEKFKMLTGTDIVHIPYKGAGPAMTDAMGGQVQLSMWTPLTVGPPVSTGKLKALALTGPKRLSIMQQVPTFAEAGLPAFDYHAWQAVFAPAGTPRYVVERVGAEIRKMLSSPKVLESLAKQGVEPFVSTPQELTAMMQRDMAESGKLIKAANIKMD